MRQTKSLPAGLHQTQKRQEHEDLAQNTCAQQSDSSGDEFSYRVHDKHTLYTLSLPTAPVKVNNHEVRLLLDTGSTLNILDQRTYANVGSPPIKRHRQSKVHAYGEDTPIHILGECVLTVETASLIQTHRFLIAQGNHGSLLGYETATKLQLIHVVHTATYKDKCREKYPGLFTDIGKLKDTQIKLHVDKTVKPKAITNRRTPFHLRKQLETELKRLEQQDIIEHVLGEPTPWVSPIVTPPKKDGSIRLCVDMREPNKAGTPQHANSKRTDP